MPLPQQRDPDATRHVLVDWLGRQLPGARDLTIPRLEIPQSSGFSNETFLFEATWREGASERSGEFVLRAQPRSYALFPHIDIIRQQYRTMKLLAEHTDVPVARVHWAEEDPEVLGQPFFVMQRVHGQVPPDNPPYTAVGFVAELPPVERRRLHESGLEAMTRVHRVDWRRIGFDHLDRPHYGAPGTQQLRGYFGHYLEWALDGAPHPVAEPAWQWLEAHWPDDDASLDLTWGDARPGNIMFRDQRVVAVFDWEMAALCNAESDLGWWLYMQRFHTEGMGVPLPEGLLDREEIVAFWEAHVGRPARHVDFYEVLGGFHFVLIMIMLGRNMLRLAPEGFDPEFGVTNPGARVLAKMLQL